MQKKANKQTKKSTKKTNPSRQKKTARSHEKKAYLISEHYPQQLEDLVSSIYSELPALQSITIQNSPKELNKLMGALTQGLESISSEALSEDLFEDPQLNKFFANQLGQVISGIKNLTRTIGQQNIAK